MTTDSLSTSRSREQLYLALSIAGFLLAGGYTLWQSVETGNWLFWTQPTRTLRELFANGTSTAFGIDLTLVVISAFVWMWHESRALSIPRVWRFWLLALLFGLAGPLPLFLYVRERRLQQLATR